MRSEDQNIGQGQESVRKKNTRLSTIALIITLIWILSALISWYVFSDWSKSGSFGDTFGAINSLFSGLALAGIIYTIHLQKNELELQRKELEYTRKELYRSANAQEETTRVMNEQIRLSNLSVIEYDSQHNFKETTINLFNKSNNTIFDLDIWLFISQDDSENPLQDFEASLDSANELKLDKEDFKLVDDSLWAICQRGTYYSFPPDRKISIPIDYKVDAPVIQFFIQYRDGSGNNYSQSIVFIQSGTNRNHYSSPIVEPNYPKVTQRVDFTDDEISKKDIPPIGAGYYDLFIASIRGSEVVNKGKFSVDNYWAISPIIEVDPLL